MPYYTEVWTQANVMPYLYRSTISNNKIVKEIRVVQLEEEEERGARRRSHYLPKT
jgi:hypothetical protein